MSDLWRVWLHGKPSWGLSNTDWYLQDPAVWIVEAASNQLESQVREKLQASKTQQGYIPCFSIEENLYFDREILEPF